MGSFVERETPEFSVDNAAVDVPETSERMDETSNSEGASEEQKMADSVVSEMVVGSVVSVVGKIGALLTKIPEVDFTPEEVDQLKALWTPIMPQMSATSGAVLGTIIIVAGKVAIYMSKRKELTVVERTKDSKDVIESKADVVERTTPDAGSKNAQGTSGQPPSGESK